MKSIAKIVIAAILGINFVLYRPDIMVRDWLTPDVGTLRGSKYIKQYAKKIVILTTPSEGNGGGTGFAVKAPSGTTYTVTNSHVCEIAEAGKMRAVWDNGRSVILNVLERNIKTDLCILDGLPIMEGMEMANDELDIGDPVFTIGHPHLAPNTFSEGLVRMRTMMDIVYGYGTKKECKERGLKSKEVPTWLGTVDVCYESFDGIDTSIGGFPGNSGSPVFNVQGKIVGVIFAGRGDINQLSYVPLEYLQDLIRTY